MTDDGDLPPDLRAENARLVALLESHGIEWRRTATVDVQHTPSALNTDQKVALFRRLFRGRTDLYPVRWESKAGKTGYAPACANEWRAGICEKPRIKCSDCGHRSLIALTDRTIFDHLAGRHTTGVYPLLTDDTCNFLAVDFDDAEWREDAKGFAKSCRELGVPVALEVSRSGEGAHAWVFFSTSVAARDARRLGTALISFTCARTRQLKLTSYDRLFPSQDTLPKGGFGNLIALPLQKQPREQGRSVFVDDALQAFPDRRMPPSVGLLVRSDPEAGQGQVRARPDGYSSTARRSAADHLHAVRSDPAHRGEAGRCTADAGGDAALPVDSDRRAFRRRNPGSSARPCWRHWKRWRQTRRESCCPPASWLARDSTTRRSTL
jgi:hypothetical protein